MLFKYISSLLGFGKIEISYTSIKGFEILIKQVNSSHCNSLSEKEEEFFKKQFDIAKKIVVKWKKKYPRRNVKLAYLVEEENNKSLEPLLSMEKHF